MKQIDKYIFAIIIALLLTVTVQSSPKEIGNLKQLKSERERHYNAYINSNCMEMGIRIVQRLSDTEYGIYRNNKFAKLYTSETFFSSPGQAHIYAYRRHYSEKVTYKTGFSESVNSYKECSRRDKNKYLGQGEQYSKTAGKYNEANTKAQKKEGCEELSKNTDKGTIYGHAKSILDDGFWFDTYKGNYYVNTSNTSTRSILSNRGRIKIIVQRTGRTREVSLLEMYPYATKEGESEYSGRAMRHVRQYPAHKFKTLEEVSLIGLWDSLCK